MSSEGFTDLYWTAADGLVLHARDYAPAHASSKAPVICIHGLTRNARDFEDLAPRIAATGRRVIAVDVRGRGLSARDPNPMNYQPPVYAGDMLALMAAEKIEQAVFVGTSMGGLITMVLAAIKPAAVAASVLNDVGPELSPVGLTRIGGYVGGGGPVVDWSDAARYAAMINGVAFPDYAETDWDRFARRLFDEKDGALALAYDPDISAPFKVAPTGPAPDLWPLLKGLAACGPLLLVRGEISDLIDADIAARMREAAPSMAYAEVPRVGHAPELTEPAAWAAIERLLAEAP
ncbi:MAG: alpha/beta hydrolase fold protein [Caulobacteraceae bacterium]|nr:alpha/beta hydrolase fold protein [Caulobacteraceae bacterium]